MKFKIFIYHYTVVIGIILILSLSLYFSVKIILQDQTEKILKAEAELLASQFNNSQVPSFEEFLDQHVIQDMGYGWIADEQGKILHYPASVKMLSPYLKTEDEEEVLPRLRNADEKFFLIDSGGERRFVYFSKVKEDKIFVVVSMSSRRVDAVLMSFLGILFLVDGLLALVSLLALYHFSSVLMKPVYQLQKYARSIDQGDVLDRADSIEEIDLALVAFVMEKLYQKAMQRDKKEEKDPLSGLPGNKALFDEINRKIMSQKPLAVGYADCNNFSAFNNRYGKERGDSVIRFLAVIILNAVHEEGNPDDKVFHLGGDRFIFITDPDKSENICRKIITAFDSHIIFYYDEEDQKKGHITTRNRDGKEGRFPLMPLCIGVATSVNRPINHPMQIGHIIGEIRNFLKEEKKSRYLIDRRKAGREKELEGEMSPFNDLHPGGDNNKEPG